MTKEILQPCGYCKNPNRKGSLPCIAAEVIKYSPNDKSQWAVIKFSYQCPKCGTVWYQEITCSPH